VPSRTSSAVTPTAIGSGRRMTAVATPCQNPSVLSATSGDRRTRRESTRWPSTASSAGRVTIEDSIARRTTAMPAYANDRRK
jgi:hypothetical protein